MAKTSTKGTKENPYSMSECEKMLNAGTWPGGYVKDDAGQVSYVMKSVTVQGYSGSGSGSNWHGSDFEFCSGSYEWHEPDTDNKGCDEDGKGTPSGNEGGGTDTGGNAGGGTGGWGGGTPSNGNVEPNAGEGQESDVHYYTYEEVETMMDKGTWQGGYVKGDGYIPKWNAEAKPIPLADTGETILARALQYEGVPYKYGGLGMDGIDCSGLVSVALGLKTRWSTGAGDIPGMEKIKFTGVDNLQKGDVLVWRWKNPNGSWGGHTVIYVKGDSIFHAHGKAGTPTGYTDNLEKYWIKYKNEPKVYRK